MPTERITIRFPKGLKDIKLKLDKKKKKQSVNKMLQELIITQYNLK